MNFIIKKIKETSPITVKSSFLGAHAIPEKYKTNPDKYVDIVIKEMIPEIAKEKLAEKDGKILATLNSKGIVELSSGKRTLGNGKVSSLVKEMPLDGLQVGRDEGGTVGDYKDAFDFNGKIKKVRIKIN